MARPWVEKAGGTYRALLDQHNQIGKTYGLKYVPVGIAVDEEGRLVRPVSSVDIGDESFRNELIDWAESGRVPAAWQQMEGGDVAVVLTPDEREEHWSQRRADEKSSALSPMRGQRAAKSTCQESARTGDPTTDEQVGGGCQSDE